MTTDLHSAHKQALIHALFEEQKDDPEFRMALGSRLSLRLTGAYCRVRDAVRVLRGRAQIRVTFD